MTDKDKQDANEDYDVRDMRASYIPNLNAQALGKLGGQKTLAKYGNSHFKNIRGVNSGWPLGKPRKPKQSQTSK